MISFDDQGFSDEYLFKEFYLNSQNVCVYEPSKSVFFYHNFSTDSIMAYSL